MQFLVLLRLRRKSSRAFGASVQNQVGFDFAERAGAEKSPPNKYYYLLGNYNGLKGLRGIINLMSKNKIQSVLT